MPSIISTQGADFSPHRLSVTPPKGKRSRPSSGKSSGGQKKAAAKAASGKSRRVRTVSAASTPANEQQHADGASRGTSWEAVEAEQGPRHSFLTMTRALVAAGLEELLTQQDEAFTVFAPTDAAFDRYLKGHNLTQPEFLDGLRADTELRKQVRCMRCLWIGTCTRVGWGLGMS